MEIDPPTDPSPAAPARRIRRKVVLGLVLLALVLTVVSFAFAYRPRPAVLVNGLAKPYTVKVNGDEHTLPPFGHKELSLRPGTVTFEATGAGVKIPQASVVVAPLWGLTDRRLIVINPDRCALLDHITRQYGSAGAVTVSGERKGYVGEPLYELRPVDFVFTPLPESTTSDKRMVILGQVSFTFRYHQESRQGDAGRVWLGWLGSESRDYAKTRAHVLHRIAIEPGFLDELPAELPNIASVGIEDVLKRAGYAQKDIRWVRGADERPANRPSGR